MDTAFHLSESWEVNWREVRDIYNTWIRRQQQMKKEEYCKFEVYVKTKAKSLLSNYTFH